VKEATLLGQRIDLEKNGNKAARGRLNTSRSACGEIKMGILMGEEITFNAKWDFRKAEIKSILAYGLSATKQTNVMGGKLHTFVSKCMRIIVAK